MSTMTRVDEGTNVEIAQFKHAINKIGLENKLGYDLEWVLNRTNSLGDIKILSTKYLALHYPELVHETALDIVFKHYNVLKILSNQKISLKFLSEYVCEEHNEISISIPSIVEKHYSNLNVFSDPRYRLPNLLIRSMLHIYKSSQDIRNPSDKYGMSRFHIACMVNDCEMVKLYLDNRISVDHVVNNDSPYFPGYTPLHFAVKCCSVQTVQLLLERNANLCLKDCKGMTALHIALENYIEFAVVSQKRFLIRSKQITHDNYPLLISHDCYAEDYLRLKSGKIISFFLKVYVQKNKLVVDDLGLSYVHLACLLKYRSLPAYGNPQNINRCVNLNSPLWPGYSPLHFAALVDDDNFLKILVEKGGDIGAKDAKGITPLDICVQRYKTEDMYMLLSSHPIWKDILFSNGKTKLLDFIAVLKDGYYNCKIFVKRLPKNFDICIPYDSPLWPGCTLLHLVILLSQNCEEYRGNYERRSELVTCIIRQSPGSLHKQNLYVPTPLDFAFRQRNKDLICQLLRGYRLLEYYLDSVDDKQLSCLHVTCARDDYSLVQQLLSWGNNVDVVYKGDSFGSVNSGWTPLHFAVANYSHSSVEILRQHGCHVLAKDTNDMTPIHLSLVFLDDYKYKDQRCTIDSLLSMSNFQDAVVDGIGLSHLHVACFYGLKDAVKRLVKNGADVDKVIDYKPNANCGSTVLSSLTELHGSTPLHLALQGGSAEVVQLLMQLGADVFVTSRKGRALLLCDFLEPRELHYDAKQLFFSTLTRSDELQKRAGRQIGLTMLHVACRTNDVALAKELLKSGADVNAQIHANSPIWPGCAPLHTLNYRMGGEPSFTASAREILELLLDRGADVTLSSAAGETPVHVAYKHCSSLTESHDYSYVRVLLHAQRDFSVNPRSNDGLSHFHVACGSNDLFIVRKLLRHAEIDVNQRVDYCARAGGSTPLHLALSKRTGSEVALRLEIADLLLRCGADVRVEDVDGNTPLNKAVECNVQNCRDLLERLVRAGADVNTKNIFGSTPLERLVLKRDLTFGATYELAPDDIKNVLKCGGHLNEFNRATGKGFLALALSRLSYQDMQDLITAVRINYPNAMKARYKGRTAIHNIVSCKVSNVSVDQCAALIDQLSGFDCSVDDRDDKGQTALHLAVSCQNVNAVGALMLVGADMGIRDSSGQVALDYNPEKCRQCESERRNNDNDGSRVNEGQCDHHIMYLVFKSYALKLKLCGSDHYVRLLDEYFNFSIFVEDEPKRYFNDDFFTRLNEVQNMKIGSSSVRFGGFFTETGLVLSYSTMSPFNREAIDDFFSSNQLLRFRQQCFGMEGIIRFQYRRAVKRWNLMEASKNALIILTGYRLPDLCSEYVLQLLSIADLENLVASMP